MTNLFCMICESTSCECKSKSRRRVGTRSSQARSRPEPVQQTEPVEAKRSSVRAARTVSASQLQENVQATPEVSARSLRQDDIDEDEDFGLIEATRMLAHLVDPRDLVAFKQYLAPSDLLPPEERRVDWLNRVHRGANDDGHLPDYVCTECGSQTPRDDLTAVKVSFGTLGSSSVMLKSRTVSWLCPRCVKKHPAWNLEEYESPGFKQAEEMEAVVKAARKYRQGLAQAAASKPDDDTTAVNASDNS